MTLSQLRTINLQVQLTLLRFGWSKSIASIICMIGLMAWLLGIPYLHTQQKALQQQWQQAQQSWHTAEGMIPTVTQTTAEQHFNQFINGLGDDRYTEQQIKTLFALADKAGLTLAQADYKLAEDKNGHYRTYQILMPVKGTYRAIRQFCEKTLLAIPFASLDEMNFKRDAIGSGTLEARLRFTIYLSAQPTGMFGNGKPPIQKDAS
ncbi:MAG TPA: hypothetical protein VIF82_16775 [Burkholderiaceae bacterium]